MPKYGNVLLNLMEKERSLKCRWDVCDNYISQSWNNLFCVCDEINSDIWLSMTVGKGDRVDKILAMTAEKLLFRPSKRFVSCN